MSKRSQRKIAMGLFDSFVQAVNREYDRRIKRASEVIEYGMGHGHGHGHGHDHDHDHDHDHNQGQQHEHDESDDDESAIANVPAGTRVEHQTEDV
jgi:ABC-type Zn2+ transport system substrate-binding protein/surface adhesin